MAHTALNLYDLLTNELAQRTESGYDVGDTAAAVAALDGREPREQLELLLGRVEATEQRADWPYEEPAGLDAIRATLPPAGPASPPPADDELRDRLLGAWLGRIAGCNLGKPVERGDHWTPERLRRYLELAGAYPLEDYIPVLDPMPEGFELRDNWPDTTRGRISGGARDDDVDYTILGLHLLETYGWDFSARDVATEWLARFPFTQVYTAERAAYRNLVHGLEPPETAGWRNPYREWIGAQIRADIFGYVAPGNPRRAAELAYRDAELSHVANGVYGEMWAAALVAASATAGGAAAALAESLRHVPPRSRLAEALRDVTAMHAAGHSWEAARAEIGQRYGHYSWVHTINNAAVIAAGLLWGEDDYTRTVGLTVQGGLDTDSNGATAGSVAGILTGAARLPSHWVEPLHDRTRSALFGFDNARISDLAERTFTLARTRPNPT